MTRASSECEIELQAPPVSKQRMWHLYQRYGGGVGDTWSKVGPLFNSWLKMLGLEELEEPEAMTVWLWPDDEVVYNVELTLDEYHGYSCSVGRIG